MICRFLIVLLCACLAVLAVVSVYAQEPVPAVPQLTPAQELTFQKSLSAFYLSAANLATSEGAVLQAQQRLETAREALKASCPGEIVDVKEKPAECRLKPAPEPVKTPSLPTHPQPPDPAKN